MNDLKNTFEELKNLPFPKSSKDPIFGDWIAELAEIDGFYAGLATTYLSGKKVRKRKLISLEHLFQDLGEIFFEKKITKKKYLECLVYLNALDNLKEEIVKLTS